MSNFRLILLCHFHQGSAFSENRESKLLRTGQFCRIFSIFLFSILTECRTLIFTECRSLLPTSAEPHTQHTERTRAYECSAIRVVFWSMTVFMIHGDTLSELSIKMHCVTHTSTTTCVHLPHVSMEKPRNSSAASGPIRK